MKKGLIFAVLMIVLVSMLLFTSCKPKVEEQTEPLFNESLNEEIENLTQIEPEEEKLTFTKRAEAKYEITQDDVFMDSKGNFTSLELSFFGVMLGDSFDEVEEYLGPADTSSIAADESYRNMYYKSSLKIPGTANEPGLTLHLENEIVTRITVTPPANNFLHGNTTIGREKELIYTILDIPDYQSFVSNFRVFYYVEKGVEVYLARNKVNRISFVFPQEFKGVEYVKVPIISAEGILVNVTRPVRIE